MRSPRTSSTPATASSAATSAGSGARETEDVEFSNRADVIAVLDALGIGRVVLVGNSLGGVVAFDTAIEFAGPRSRGRRRRGRGQRVRRRRDRRRDRAVRSRRGARGSLGGWRSGRADGRGPRRFRRRGSGSTVRVSRPTASTSTIRDLVRVGDVVHYAPGRAHGRPDPAGAASRRASRRAALPGARRRRGAGRERGRRHGSPPRGDRSGCARAHLAGRRPHDRHSSSPSDSPPPSSSSWRRCRAGRDGRPRSGPRWRTPRVAALVRARRRRGPDRRRGRAALAARLGDVPGRRPEWRLVLHRSGRLDGGRRRQRAARRSAASTDPGDPADPSASTGPPPKPGHEVYGFVPVLGDGRRESPTTSPTRTSRPSPCSRSRTIASGAMATGQRGYQRITSDLGRTARPRGARAQDPGRRRRTRASGRPRTSGSTQTRRPRTRGSSDAGRVRRGQRLRRGQRRRRVASARGRPRLRRVRRAPARCACARRTPRRQVSVSTTSGPKGAAMAVAAVGRPAPTASS